MDYDAELQTHLQPLLRACAIRNEEHVLDIGCGTGQTTREAARHAPGGRVMGIDTSEAMIQRARDLANTEGLRNISFECGDAQVAALPRRQFDLAMSRYGTMF